METTNARQQTAPTVEAIVLRLNYDEALLLIKSVGAYSLSALERFQYMAQSCNSGLYSKGTMDSAWDSHEKADLLWNRIDDAMQSQKNT